VPAFRIIEALDVVEYISSRLVSGPVRFAPCALGLRALSQTLPLDRFRTKAIVFDWRPIV
jgi:hypothetical protein